MPEENNGTTQVEKPKGPSIESLQAKIMKLTEQLNDVKNESIEHRRGKQQYKRQLEEQTRTAEQAALELDRYKSTPSESAARIAELETELKTVKFRGVFDRVAREAGVHDAPKALSDLWESLGLDLSQAGEPDDTVLAGLVDAARSERPYLFRPADDAGTLRDDSAQGSGQGSGPAKIRPATSQTAPPTAPGPGVTRPAASGNNAGSYVVKKSDLQSFDPAVNPLMNPVRKAQLAAAHKDGRVQYEGFE